LVAIIPGRSRAPGRTHDPDGTSDADHDDARAYRGLRVQLPAFEGPLDLLLHLIQRDEIDIADIPIAHITRQYLDHLDLMRELDLELAGEYLVMAATLVRIKSQMLLPSPICDEDGEEIDPRADLVRRLIEYRKFKEAAGMLRDREGDRLRRHGRGPALPELPPDEIPIGQVSVFDLVTYLRQVLARVAAEAPVHRVALESVSLEERIAVLRARLALDRQFLFSDFLLDVRTRHGVIVSFMALLELLRLGEALAVQETTFDDILIRRRDIRGQDRDA
jgi:segregation and condensation protein A